MAAELIGPCRCPLCSGKARLTLSRNRLPVLTCNGCQIQLFARSDRSDQLARALLVKGETAPAPAATPAPVESRGAPPAAPPVPTPTPSPKPAAPVPPDIAQAAANAQAQGFGLLKDWFQPAR